MNIHKSHPPKSFGLICFTVLIFLNTSLAFQYFFAEFFKITAPGVGFLAPWGSWFCIFLCAEAGEFALSKKFPRSLPGAGGDGQAWNCNDRNEPPDYKSFATGTVNHESNLLSCEISLQVVMFRFGR